MNRENNKLRKDSFAARLSGPQKDELFEKLAGGMGLADAAQLAHAWTKAEWGGKPPSTQAVSDWFAGEKVERRMSAARAAALVAQASAPADIDDQARRALGQAKFMAMLQEMTPMDIALLEKNEIARQKLELDRQKLAQDNRVSRLSLTLERAKLLLQRSRGGETGEDLQSQIDLALEEIEKMKRGED